MLKPAIHFCIAGFIFCAQSGAKAMDDISELSLEQLLTVNVVGASKYEQKQSEVAAAVSIITRNDIKAFGWRTLDEALASLPGIYTTYDRQYVNLGTRGFGLPGDYNTRVLLLINGNRANDPTFDAATFGIVFPLDMDLIERIEFIPGPGGAVYGQNAMFGVVNVITRRGATVDGAELATAYQSPQAQRAGRATWGKLFDNGLDVLLSVSGMRAHGEDRFFAYPGAAVPSGMATGLDGARNEEFFARIARGPWSFEHAYGTHRKDDPTGAYFSDPLVPGQYQNSRNALTQLHYQESFSGDTLQVTGRLFAGQYRYGTHLSYYGMPISYPSQSDWYGAELRLLSTAVDCHKWMVGIEAQDNARTDQNILNSANPTYDILIPGSSYRAGLYVQDEWRIGQTLTSTLGLRMDRNDATGTKFSPRAALIWQFAPATTIKALYGRAHRAPNIFERNYFDGIAQVKNPTLSGETIDTMELVADHLIGHDLALRGSMYRWNMQGLVTKGATVSVIPEYYNGAGVTAHGVELSADKTWNSGARLRGSLSAQSASRASGIDLSNSPQLLGKLNFSSLIAATDLRLGYALQYSGTRQALDGTKLDGYWLSNLNLTADKWARGLEVSLGFYNLFDQRYQQPGGTSNWQNAFVQDGRSVRFKLDYRF